MKAIQILGALLIGAASATAVQAQSYEAFGTAGYGRTFRIEDANLGSGLIRGAGIAFRPRPRIRLEGAVENLRVLAHPRDHVANVLHPRGSIAYEFSDSPVRAFIIGGAGAARIRQVVTITYPARVEIQDKTETAFAVHFGGGIAVAAGPRVTIRPQVVVVPTIASRSNINWIQTSVQVAFGW